MFDPAKVAMMIISGGSSEAEEESEEDGSAGPDALKAFAEAIDSKDWAAAYDAFRVAVQSCGYEDE